MKYLALLVSMLLAGSASANLLLNAGFDQGVDGLDAWEGFEAGVVDPASFVSITGTSTPYTAQVRNFNAAAPETAFYQTFYTGVGGNPLPSGTYQFSATISNLSDPNARMFIKVWDIPLDWGTFVGPKFQNVLLTPGLMTLTYEHDGSDLVQFGFSVEGGTTVGFDLVNPTLTVVPEPSTLALAGVALGMLAWRRLRRG